MSQRKLLLFDTIKYIFIQHSKHVFQKYLVHCQKLTPKTQKLNIRKKEKIPTKIENKQKIAEAISVICHQSAIT